MSLSLADMENVVRIVDRKVDSVAAAAELLGTDRAYVYRLIQRVNDMIGQHAPSWREGTRLVIPAEIHRLATCMRSLADAFDQAARFPRIAAGNTLAILIHEVLQEIQWEQSSYQILLRAVGAVDALRSGEIDLHLLHESSLERRPEDLEQVRLLEWTAVIVEPLQQPEPEKMIRQWLAWPSDSHAARLNARVLGEEWRKASEHPGPSLGSYVAALEAIRIGLPFKMVVPDIYLMPGDRQALKMIHPSSMVKEWLVGLYRRSDQARLQSLIESRFWERVSGRRRCS
ncbi:MAG: hypothetical protein U1F76_08320 [Candidatus Competibacteraceae bacterium]